MAGTGVREGSVLYQGVNRSTVAFKLMKQMGWEEGEGLGANKQGIKSHVRATKKADVTAGVGLAEARKMASDWTQHTSVYDKLLKSLKSVYENPGPAAAGAKGGSDDDDSDSDSDISEEKGVVDASKKSSEEEVIVETTKKITRPQGRYKKREAGKAVKSYSCTDLAAILGGDGVNPPKKEEVNSPKKEEVKPLKKEEPKSDVKERDAATVKTSDNPSSGALTSRGEAELLKTSRTLKPLRVVHVVDASVKSLVEEADLPSVGDWWGSKFGFVQAGTLVGSSEMDNERANRDERDGKSSSKDEIQISMFQEEDQERLYKAVQDKATTGKMGLGRSSMPKKVAGARWTGKKMQFCSDDEEDEDDEDDNDVMDSDNSLPNGGCGGTATETAAGPKGDDVPSVAKEPCEDADANCIKKNVVQTDEGEQAEKSTGEIEEPEPRKEKAGKRKKKKRERGEMQEATRASPEPSSSCEQASVEDPPEDGMQKKRSTPMIAERTDRSRDMGAGSGKGEVVGGIVENGLMEAEGLGDRRNPGNQRRKGVVNDSRMAKVSGKEEACESLGCGDGDEVAGKSEDRREKKRRKKLKEATPVAGSSEAAAKEAASDGKLLSKERHDDPSLNNAVCQTRTRKGIEKVEEAAGREREGARDGADEYNHASSANADGESDMWSENLDKALKRVKWKRLTADVLQKALSEGVKLRVLERMVRRAVRAMDPGIDETKLQSVYRRKLQESSRFAVFGKRVFIAECEPVP
eukprot:TRINITY_DN869_c0_g1_i8.p1 TRINITY_DN869_c0_g1~~TRINITY_DN869_c0_g1_i8.p1  ORF type:complete len:750 (+),score=217.82 TRINITY_DN869_c0_g1_i8:369-2618(+)